MGRRRGGGGVEEEEEERRQRRQRRGADRGEKGKGTERLWGPLLTHGAHCHVFKKYHQNQGGTKK
jgi:hypothetical protein